LLKGPVQRFLKQVAMNKHFFLNGEKILVQIRAVVFGKNIKIAQLRRTSIPPNATKVSFSNYLQTKLFKNKVIKL